MRQRRTIRAITGVVAAAAVGLAGAVMAIPAAAAEANALVYDFESGQQGWTGRGATVSVVEGGHESVHALSVTGRTENWNGPALPVGSIITEGVYSISAWVKLDDPAVESAKLNLGMEQPDAPNPYPWVGGRVDVTNDAWVQLSGTYAVLPDTPPTQLYVESEEGQPTVKFLVDDVVILGEGTTTPPDYEAYEGSWNFDDGTLQGWVRRNVHGGDTSVAPTDAEKHEGTHAVLVSDRTGQGDGVGYDFTGVFVPGVEYEISAWVKMAEGEPSDSIVLSIQTGPSTFANIFTQPATADEWVNLTTSYTFPGGDKAFMYFESPYAGGANGTNYSFLVDTISIKSVAPSDIEDLAGIYTEFEGMFPVGVAIDRRETVGTPAELTLRHFNQITPENHMKVEAWYEDGPWQFGMHEQADALLGFAAENDLSLYGHVLVWHSQTPDWFFQDEEGNFLTSDDYDEMKSRLETHIKNVAEAISDEYGLFGSDTNPMVAWDVVNEVVSDQAAIETDGLRNSYWYQIMGENYIDLAFEYADKYFNDVYAVDDSVVERPIKLFINDYNTEQSGKQNRYYALVERLIDRGVPIDGVGHQFHVSLSMPVEALRGALERFKDFDLIQAVTELDVTVGNSPTNALLVEQGYYYRDAFRVFRDYADDLFSVTIWGLSDNRSWRSEQAPLVFNSRLLAKPAYYGIVDGDMPGRIRTANVFRGEPAVSVAGLSDVTWDQLPLNAIGNVAEFQLRWAPSGLTAYVSVDDDSVEATDQVQFTYGADGLVTVKRSDANNATRVVRSTASGWEALVKLPALTSLTQNGTLLFDIAVTDGTTVTEWADGEGPAALGTLNLLEPLSYVEVAKAPEAPEIDGDVDDVWRLSSTVTTSKNTQGSGGAWATVKTLWSGDGQTLYVLMDVTDSQLNADASNPWEQDSVEIYVDRGNYKNGSYRYDDNQFRIDYEGDVSFGTGDEAFQASVLDYAVEITDRGYRVEAAIDLLENYGGPGTFHGVDFQVNDATDGVRTSIRNWADPTGNGYQSTARWGVAKLVDEVTLPFTDVAGNPFRDEIVWMWQSGLATGYDDGSFRPAASVSRQAMAAFLYRAVTGEDTLPTCTTAPFADVTVGNQFCGAIEWLVDNGLATGYADGTFRPTAPISRQAMAAFLSRIENGPEAEVCTEAPFVDVPVGHPFCAEIAWLKGTGITTGYEDGTFRPTTPISRQAMAAFLYRGIVRNGMFDELWTPPTPFVPGGAVDPVIAPSSAARGTGNRVALTFDDGPMYAEDTNRLLDFLKENEIQAVFCVIGQNIKAAGGADLLRRMVEDGHVLCNHSTSYADMGSWSQAQVRADLIDNLEIIRTALGDPDHPVPYFRAPNGSWGQTPQVAVELGMQPLALGNTILDWEDAVQADLEALKENLRNAFEPGAIVLAHVGGGSSRANTVDAVIAVVEEMLDAGWEFTLPVGGLPTLEPVPVGPKAI